MAIRKVEDCVGCGLSPCYHCERTAFICDMCNEEEETLYDATPLGIEEEQICFYCLKEFVQENIDDVAKYLCDEVFKKYE